MNLESISIAPDGTHHRLDGQPLYQPRFGQVLKFHPPGLAAVSDSSASYHITPAGRPAYRHRYSATFGFYGGRAAVHDESGWFHILKSGLPLYRERYAWCGNYQQERVPVRDQAGLYYHLDADGKRVYQEAYLYAGDYRDGIACVRQAAGLCTHIDFFGIPVHAGYYLDLDVFHKGFARARDYRGWCHIRADGKPAYTARFEEIEAFYNGQAFARILEGDRVLLNESGAIIHVVWHGVAIAAPDGQRGKTART